jgi:fatty acid amide hydrolase
MLIPTVIGPIARRVEDCALFMKATQVPELWEGVELPRIPFNDEVYQRPGEKLKIGYFDTDGWFEPAPPQARCSETVVYDQGWTPCILNFHRRLVLRLDCWRRSMVPKALSNLTGSSRRRIMIDEYTHFLGDKASRVVKVDEYCCSLTSAVGICCNKGRAGGLPCGTVAANGRHGGNAQQMVRCHARPRCGCSRVSCYAPAFKHGLSVFLTAACSYMFLSNMLDCRRVFP